MKKIKYKSDLEADTADQIEAEGIKFHYERDKFKYDIPASTHKYCPDFIIPCSGGKTIYLECKGAGPRYGLTEVTKQKLLLVKRQYPDMDLRLVFQQPNAITGQGKGKPKVTYGEWATINGFTWYNRELPKSFYKEVLYS